MTGPEARVNWSLRRKLPRAVRLALFIAVLAIVAIASLLPDVKLMAAWSIDDKAIHAMVYAIVVTFTILIFERTFLSAATVLIFSGGIELAQSFVPARIASWGDFAANGAGIAVALGVMAVMGVLGYSVVAAKIGSQEANEQPAE